MDRRNNIPLKGLNAAARPVDLYYRPQEQGVALPDLIEDGDGSVRVLDLTLAERLGYERPRTVRDLIKRNRGSLEAIGSLLHRAANPSAKGGRPGTAYYLTEAQACFIVAKSETALANSELVHLSQVFTEFRKGNLVATDAETQARLEVYQAEREARLARHLEDREARSVALKFIGRGGRRKRHRVPTGG